MPDAEPRATARAPLTATPQVGRGENRGVGDIAGVPRVVGDVVVAYVQGVQPRADRVIQAPTATTARQRRAATDPTRGCSGA